MKEKIFKVILLHSSVKRLNTLSLICPEHFGTSDVISLEASDRFIENT